MVGDDRGNVDGAASDEVEGEWVGVGVPEGAGAGSRETVRVAAASGKACVAPGLPPLPARVLETIVDLRRGMDWNTDGRTGCGRCEV